MSRAFVADLAPQMSRRRPLAVMIFLALAAHAARADELDPQQARQLAQVTVTAVSNTDNYHAGDATAGVLGTRSVLDTPFCINAVTAELIQNRQAIDINDVFKADAATTPLASGYSGESSGFAVRGLPVDLLNGYKMDGLSIPNWGSDLPLEEFGQVELLKGPGGFMYGFGQPGGIINFISKQPTQHPYASFTLGYLSDGVLRETADVGGTVGGKGGWGYRVNAAHEEGDTFVHGSHIRRNAASLALTRDLAPDLHWHLNSIYQDRKVSGAYYGIILGQDFGIPVAEPVRVPAPLDGGQRVAQPFSGYQTTLAVVNTGLQWDLSPDWNFSLDYSYARQTRDNNDSALIITDNQGSYTDLNFLGHSIYNNQQWQAMFSGRFDTAMLKHDVVFGAAWQALDAHYPAGAVSSQQLGAGNLFNAPLFADPRVSAGNANYLADATSQRTLFASDTVAFSSQWSALLGLRYVNFVDKAYNPGEAAPAARYQQKPVTPTAAVIYKPIEPVSIYLSFVKSLEQGGSAPQTAVNAYQTFAPTTSKQFELGAKAEFSTWNVNLALFRVDRGLQYLNADNVYVQSGQTRYQGIDLSSQMTLAEHWTLLGGVMLLDAGIVRAGEDVNGKRAYGAPRLEGNLYVEYAVPQLTALVLNAGGRYIGNQALEADNSHIVAAYHTFDIGARYTTALGSHAIIYRAGIDNLTNEKYWLTSFGFILNQGSPRSVRASVTLTL